MLTIDRRKVLMGGAALLATPAIVRAQGALTQVRFTLDWKLQGPHALYFLAKEKGILPGRGTGRDHRPGRRARRPPHRA